MKSHENKHCQRSAALPRFLLEDSLTETMKTAASCFINLAKQPELLGSSGCIGCWFIKSNFCDIRKSDVCAGF